MYSIVSYLREGDPEGDRTNAKRHSKEPLKKQRAENDSKRQSGASENAHGMNRNERGQQGKYAANQKGSIDVVHLGSASRRPFRCGCLRRAEWREGIWDSESKLEARRRRQLSKNLRPRRRADHWQDGRHSSSIRTPLSIDFLSLLLPLQACTEWCARDGYECTRMLLRVLYSCTDIFLCFFAFACCPRRHRNSRTLKTSSLAMAPLTRRMHHPRTDRAAATRLPTLHYRLPLLRQRQ